MLLAVMANKNGQGMPVLMKRKNEATKPVTSARRNINGHQRMALPKCDRVTFPRAYPNAAGAINGTQATAVTIAIKIDRAKYQR